MKTTATSAPIFGPWKPNSLQLVEKLVEHKGDVNARLERGASGRGVLTRRGATPFLLAAATADVPLMRALVKHGADPRLPNSEHCTPLMAAAGVGTLAPGEEAGTEPEALEAVALAIKLGGDVNAVDDNGETAMHGAAYKNFPGVKNLFADGACARIVRSGTGRTGRVGRRCRSLEGHMAPATSVFAETIAALHRVMLAKGISPAPNSTPIEDRRKTGGTQRERAVDRPIEGERATNNLGEDILMAPPRAGNGLPG